MRCRDENIVPARLQVKPLVKTREGHWIAERASRAFVRELDSRISKPKRLEKKKKNYFCHLHSWISCWHKQSPNSKHRKYGRCCYRDCDSVISNEPILYLFVCPLPYMTYRTCSCHVLTCNEGLGPSKQGKRLPWLFVASYSCRDKFYCTSSELKFGFAVGNQWRHRYHPNTHSHAWLCLNF